MQRRRRTPEPLLVLADRHDDFPKGQTLTPSRAGRPEPRASTPVHQRRVPEVGLGEPSSGPAHHIPVNSPFLRWRRAHNGVVTICRDDHAGVTAQTRRVITGSDSSYPASDLVAEHAHTAIGRAEVL